MTKWKSETGANGTCYWINLSDNIELSLFRKNINDSIYLYRFRWEADSGIYCSWTEHITVENLKTAKEKVIKKTNKIINRYLTELKNVLEVLNGESENGSLG